MKISLVYQGENPCHLKTFLRQQGISRGLLAKIRHEGGAIDVDGTSGRKLDMIFPNAVVTLTMPPENTIASTRTAALSLTRIIVCAIILRIIIGFIASGNNE